MHRAGGGGFGGGGDRDRDRGAGVGEVVDVAVGLDARNGMLATHGWQEQSTVSALDAGIRFAETGVKHIVFTDIGRDGRLEGPNISALVDMTQTIAASVIASGGVSSLDDIRSIKRTRATGVIIGAALYHDRISLKDAIEIAKGDKS